MKTWRGWVLALAVIGLIGCASSPSTTLTKAQLADKAKLVRNGMAGDEVVKQLGPPRTREKNAKDPSVEIIVYTGGDMGQDMLVITVRNGVVEKHRHFEAPAP